MAQAKIKLTIFVKTYESGKTLSQLYKALEFHDYGDYELDIIDVLKEPIRATSLGVRETPTLMMHTESGDIFMTSDLNNILEIRNAFGFKTS